RAAGVEAGSRGRARPRRLVAGRGTYPLGQEHPVMNFSFGRTPRDILPRLRPQRRPRRAGRPCRRPQLETLEERCLLIGSWIPVANLAPSTIGTMMLLSDGTVMAQGGGQVNTWFKLTPDAGGSYANGTWSRLASMTATRRH